MSRDRVKSVVSARQERAGKESRGAKSQRKDGVECVAQREHKQAVVAGAGECRCRWAGAQSRCRAKAGRWKRKEDVSRVVVVLWSIVLRVFLVRSSAIERRGVKRRVVVSSVKLSSCQVVKRRHQPDCRAVYVYERGRVT